MENTPNEAPAAVSAESVATPNTNDNAEAPKAPETLDMHGFTSDQLANMRKFFDNNGGYDKVKSRISNPTPAPAEEQKPVEPSQPAQPAQTSAPYTPPAGAITQGDLATKLYFESLARQDKYKEIADDITNGNVIKEMDSLGIPYVNRDGSLNPDKLFGYLDMKAKTVPAKQTSSMPEASAAPTVDYVPVGDSITSADQARQIIMQDSQLRRQGQAGHPSVKMAEDYLRNMLSGEKK